MFKLQIGGTVNGFTVERYNVEWKIYKAANVQIFKKYIYFIVAFAFRGRNIAGKINILVDHKKDKQSSKPLSEWPMKFSKADALILASFIDYTLSKIKGWLALNGLSATYFTGTFFSNRLFNGTVTLHTP